MNNEIRTNNELADILAGFSPMFDKDNPRPLAIGSKQQIKEVRKAVS